MAPKHRPETVTRAHFTRTITALRHEMDAIRADAQARVKAAYWSGMQDGEDEPGLSSGGRVWKRGYRTVRMTIRDETSTSQEAAIERSYRQYATNPLAFAIANVRTDYVWGDGPVITADNDKVQAVLDAHWYDDVNNWEEKGAQCVRDLGLYGELFIEAFVRYNGTLGDGLVRRGTIDPVEIDSIITDAQNREEIVAIRLKAVPGEEQQRGRLLKVICTDPETGRLVGVKEKAFPARRGYEANAIIPRLGRRWRVVEANRETDEFESGWDNVRAVESCYGRAWRVSEAHSGIMYQDRVGAPIEGVPYDGQVFVIQVNKTSIGMRGRPDGLALIDWLDRVDQLFFDILEHSALLKDITWDLLVNGADDKELQKRAREFVAAQSQAGRVYAHNQEITLTDRNPDLKGADWDSLYNTILNFIAGGARLPVYMLGSGGDANLATATAQGSPTYRGFETRQGVVRRMLVRILQYQVDCAVEAKRLPEYVEILDENGEPKVDKLGLPIRVLARDAFDVQMPEISPRDTAAAASTFAALASAVTALYSMKLLPLQSAVEIIARGVELLGVELDIEKLVEALQKEGAPDTSGLAGALDLVGGMETPTAVELTPSMVQGALQIVQKVAAGEIPYESGVNTLVTLFGLSEEAAKRLLGGNTGGNGQQPNADLSKLLAVMNQGTREEPKQS